MELNGVKKRKRSLKRCYSPHDELYTPAKLVKILVPYLHVWSFDFKKEHDRSPIIWCPFDTEDSEFVRVLCNEGFNVKFSHINNGGNFFTYEPFNWDIPISNPPFSKKMDIFGRLFELGKPFAMLCNEMIINYQEVANLFTQYEIQMLCPDKKISFDGNTSSFATGYFCWKFLPSDLIFCHMEDNNSGKFFEPAKMFKDKQKAKL